MTRPFRVVTHKNWLAEQFQPMGGVQDWGFDIDPRTALDTIWWAPGAWVSGAMKAGVKLPVLSCGPYWLEGLPWDYRGRWVETCTLAHAKTAWERQSPNPAVAPRIFIKLPEAKVDQFPAVLHHYTRRWRTTLEQYHIPDESLVQMQGELNFRVEARFWVVNREVVTGSLYKFDGYIWGSPEFEEKRLNHAQDYGLLRRFAERVAQDARTGFCPGYVLDVGIEATRGPLVVEANAAWSSGPYDGDPAAILKCVTAAHDFDGRYRDYLWSGHRNPVWDKVQPLKVVTR